MKRSVSLPIAYQVFDSLPLAGRAGEGVNWPTQGTLTLPSPKGRGLNPLYI